MARRHCHRSSLWPFCPGVRRAGRHLPKRGCCAGDGAGGKRDESILTSRSACGGCCCSRQESRGCRAGRGCNRLWGMAAELPTATGIRLKEGALCATAAAALPASVGAAAAVAAVFGGGRHIDGGGRIALRLPSRLTALRSHQLQSVASLFTAISHRRRHPLCVRPFIGSAGTQAAAVSTGRGSGGHALHQRQGHTATAQYVPKTWGPPYLSRMSDVSRRSDLSQKSDRLKDEAAGPERNVAPTTDARSSRT